MFVGPPLDESSSLLAELPPSLVQLLRQRNGFIAFDGGLHMRGICASPSWHSLERAWRGSVSIGTLFPNVAAADVPFAQDCVGDQFLLRGTHVLKLRAETGEVEDLGTELEAFLRAAHANPSEFLGLEPLEALHQRGLRLQPGQLIHVYPPFCTKESAQGVSLRPVPVDEALLGLSQFAAVISTVPDGRESAGQGCGVRCLTSGSRGPCGQGTSFLGRFSAHGPLT